MILISHTSLLQEHAAALILGLGLGKFKSVDCSYIRIASVASTASTKTRYPTKPKIVSFVGGFLQPESSRNVTPCRQSSSRHIQRAPQNLCDPENRRSGQIRWFVGSAEIGLRLRANGERNDRAQIHERVMLSIDY